MSHFYRCFVAGKSGGHILPALTKAKEFLNESSSIKVIFIATDNALDKKLLRDESDLHIYHLPLKPFPGKKLWYYPRFIYSFVYSFFKSMLIFYTTKPDSIISMGGLISVPVCFASSILRIPYTLYELNVIPGKATKLLSRWATTVNICFEETQQAIAQPCTVVPYPLGTHLFNEENKKSDDKTLLIMGGSQGSVFLNNIIKEWIVKKNIQGLRIIHQTGIHEEQTLKMFYQHQALRVDVFAFDPDIKKHYANADLVVCRAGAGTLFELAALQKPCIAIPLAQTITDHQWHNAQAMSKKYSFIQTLSQEEIMNDREAFFTLLNQTLSMDNCLTFSKPR